jgi:hypothetical protein
MASRVTSSADGGRGESAGICGRDKRVASSSASARAGDAAASAEVRRRVTSVEAELGWPHEGHDGADAAMLPPQLEHTIGESLNYPRDPARHGNYSRVISDQAGASRSS